MEGRETQLPKTSEQQVWMALGYVGQVTQVLSSGLNLSPWVAGGPSTGPLDALGQPVHGHPAPALAWPCPTPPPKAPAKAAWNQHLPQHQVLHRGWDTRRVA